MLPCKARKAITPVVASVILLAIVIAVSLATVAWLSGLTTSFMQVEELYATNHQWGPNVAYVDVTLNNIGTQSVTLTSVTVNSQPASVIYITGSSQISSGESAVLRISSTFVVGSNYQFTFQTGKGNRFFYLATAEQVSSIFEKFPNANFTLVDVSEQMLEIANQKQYKTPGMLLS